MKLALGKYLGTVAIAQIKVFLKLALKAVVKASIIAMVLFGMAAVGLLVQSPMRTVNDILMYETFQAANYLRYLPVFVPIWEMLIALQLWVVAIVVWYTVKWALRLGKIIS